MESLRLANNKFIRNDPYGFPCQETGNKLNRPVDENAENSVCKTSERCRECISAEFFQEPAGGILMDTRNNDRSPASPLLDNHGCRFTGADTFSLMFGKYAIALDGSRIIIIDDGPGAGTCRKCDAPRVTVMPVNNDERKPVIGVRLIGSSTEYQQGTAVLDKPPDARGRSAEGWKEVGIGRVRKSSRDDEAIERGPVERGREHVGSYELADDPAVLDKAVEMLGGCPDKPGPVVHPLITPMGERRATSREMPTSCTTFTTSSLGL